MDTVLQRATRGILVGLAISITLSGCRGPVEQLTVTPPAIDFAAVGQSAQLTVLLGSADGGRDVTDPAGGTTYASANDEVAVVSPGGLVTAVGPGSTTVRVEVAGRTVDVDITVPMAASAFEGVLFAPADGETGVAVTRESIVSFEPPVDPASIAGQALVATVAGEALAARTVVSPDGRKITLFYDGGLPDGEAVQLMLDGDLLATVTGGAVDADGDGEPGGQRTITFQTLSLERVAGTEVCGRVIASELDPDGANVMLEGVTITVDGLEADVRAETDEAGRFCLQDAPAGRIFVHVDGRTARNTPAGFYYPFVGKAWATRAGERVGVGLIYLPAVATGALRPVSDAADVEIQMADAQLATVTDPQLRAALEDIRLTVPANSLFADDGTHGGQVGIAPVEPDRLPGRLPPGLQFPVVITVQTDGATNFDRPAPICFPNLADPTTGALNAPGARNALWSFNHDTGRFEIVGPMTVTADGAQVCADAGVGVPAPGWLGADNSSGGDLVIPPLPAPPRVTCPEFEPELFSIIRAAGTCLRNISGLSSIARTLNTITSELNTLKTLRNGLADAAMRLGAGDAAEAEVDMLVTGLKATKEVLKRATEAATSGPASPLGKARAAVDCANRLLDLGKAPCMMMLDAPDACSEPYERAACEELPDILETVTLAKNLLSALDQRFRDVLFLAVCESIDRTEDLLRRSAREGTGAESSELLAELEILLDTLEPFVLEDDELELVDGWLSGVIRWTAAFADAYVAREGPAPGAYIMLSYGEVVQRFRAEESGRYSAVLDAGTVYELGVYDAVDQLCGAGFGASAPIGERTDFHGPVLGPCAEVDSDGDGLPDEAEEIIGTAPDDADTDDDAVDDGTEVRDGTDPFTPQTSLGPTVLVDFGETVDGDIFVAGRIDRWQFLVPPDQPFFLDIIDIIGDASAIPVAFELVAPDGTVVFTQASFDGVTDFFDVGPLVLSLGGRYTLSVRALDERSLFSYRFRAGPPPIAGTSSIDLDEPVVSQGIAGGDFEEWLFLAATGQRVFLDFEDIVIEGGDEDSALEIELRDPLDAVIVEKFAPTAFDAFVDAGPLQLDEPGQYRLLVRNTTPGTVARYALEVVDSPIHTAALPPGLSAEGAITIPGEIDAWTFEVTAPATIDVDLLDVSAAEDLLFEIMLTAPDGTPVFDERSFDTLFDFIDQRDVGLSATGTYTLTVRAVQDIDTPFSYGFAISGIP